jgi:hypothetical protein
MAPAWEAARDKFIVPGQFASLTFGEKRRVAKTTWRNRVIVRIEIWFS